MADPQQTQTDPWAEFRTQAPATAQPSVAAPQVAASAPVNTSSDPWAEFRSSEQTSAPAPSTSDPWNEFRTADNPHNTQPPTVSDPDESTLGKVWDWVNKPLLDATRLGTREGAGPIESGVEHGLERVASGFTSPLSIALLLTTGGLGSLAEGAGAEAIEAFSPEIAAAVKPAASAIGKLMNLGFTGQQIYSVSQAVPKAADAIKAGDTEAATEYITEAIANGLAATASAKHLAGKFGDGAATGEDFVFPGDKEAIGAHQQKAEQANLSAKNFEDANRDLIRNKPLDMAAQLYHEAGGDTSVLAQQNQEIQNSSKVSDAIKAKYATIFKLAENLPDDVKSVSDKLRADYTNDYARGQQIGMFASDREPTPNYAGQHTYNPEDASESSVKPAGQPGNKSPEFTKARTFPTLADAIKAGFEPTDTGLAGARGNYIRQFGQAEGYRAAENTLQQTKAASDSAPIGVDPAKVRSVTGKYEDGSVAKNVRSIALPQGVDLTKLADGDRLIIGENGKSYVDVSDYKQGPDKFNMYRVAQTAFDENGEPKPIFERQNLLIHPDYVKPVMQAFQDTSWFRQNPITNAALKLSTEAKKSLLSFSPFHWATEGERGLQMGLNPAEVLHPAPIDPDGIAMSKGTKYGLTLLGDTASRGLADEGISSGGSHLINKIPVVGKLLQGAEDQLFGNYIPRLKAASFESVADQLSKKNPNWSEAEVMMRASKIVNGAFGGINWKQLGVSLSSQDALRLAFLAPDFSGSQILFAHAGLEPGGSVVWQSMARMALYNMAVAQTINLLHTGKVYMDHPFSVVSADGKKSYSIRTMPTDIAHMLTNPRGFISDRLNPITTKPAIEFLTGKDQIGRTRSYDQQLTDLIKNVVPITFQGALPDRNPDDTMLNQVGKGLGVRATPNRSVAMTLAVQKSSGRTPEGAVPQGLLAQHQFANGLIDKVRSGEIKQEDVYQHVLDGKITVNDAKRIMEEARMPELSARVHSLPLNDALDVYAVATQQEKQELFHLLQKKVETFHKSEMKTKTPEQRLFLNNRIHQILVPPEQPSAAPADNGSSDLLPGGSLVAAYHVPQEEDFSANPALKAVAQAEGFFRPGTLPNRTHNPGDVAIGDRGQGTVQSAGQGATAITQFPSDAEGWRELNKVVMQYIQKDPNMNWFQLAARYAPGAQSAQWAVNAAHSAGVNPNSPVREVYQRGQNQPVEVAQNQ